MTMLVDQFRRANHKLNERCFQASANTFPSYLSWIDHYLPEAGIILDLGAGAVTLETYLPRVGNKGILLIAADAVPNGIIRNNSKTKVIANAESLPFDNETLDVIAASCVFEHIENPAPVISECFRTLKKGGALVFYTPNRRSYVAALARMTPLSFHRWVRMLQTGRPIHEIEVIRTFYRMNTRSDLEQYSRNFSLVSLETHIGAPCYTTFLPPPIHLIFVMFHKILQKVSWLRQVFGETITGCLVKP